MVHGKEYLHFYWRGYLLLLTCFVLSLSQSGILVEAKGADYYTAAVLEHVRYDDFSKSTAEEVIRTNLDIYATATETAAKEGTDIIVFPEWGLYRPIKGNRSSVLPFAENIPDPSKGYWNPCENQSLFKDRPILSRLSCLARNNALYLVANLADIKKCVAEDSSEVGSDCSTDSTQCPADGMEFFNTNIVFNRNGTLVTRYYKTHPYFAIDFNIAAHPESAYFETDFGLFTTITCFDIIFREAVETVERKNVVNVAFPTSWFDHLPLMRAIQFQESWAMSNRVNLLAADVHRPGTGTIGSGIYAGKKGALAYTFNPDGKIKLMIARVPMEKDFSQNFEANAKIFSIHDGGVEDVTHDSQDSEVPEQCSGKILGLPKDLKKDYRCSELNTTGYSFKKLEEPEGSLQVCQNGTCCSLSYSADSMKEAFYLGVNSGITWIYDTYGFCVQICLLVRCDKGDASGPCSTYPLTSKTKFRNLKLSGNFTAKHVYPSLMKSKIRLASTQEWEFRNEDGHAEITFRASEDEGQILEVGLNGRCYDKDPPSL